MGKAMLLAGGFPHTIIFLADWVPFAAAP
jgi:hypothetical protein